MASELTYEGSRRELSTDQGTLVYHEAGQGPPLLLLHGSGPGVTGWRNFRGSLPRLADHFRCLVLELPNFGISDAIDGHPMLTSPGAVIRFLDALQLDVVHVVGNSMGGIVALNVAMAHPQRIDRIVTVGGVGKNLFSSSPSEGINLLVEFTEDPTRERLVQWLRSMVHDPSMITEDLVEERWQHATDPATLEGARRMYGRAQLEAGLRFMESSPEPPYWARLHTIRSPVLLTWGRDDRVSPLDMALLPMRTIPRAELHVFPRCGHWTMIEQREAFEGVVVDFLTRPAPS